MSSPPSVLSSMVNGGTSLLLRILSSCAMISISPVARFLFLLERSSTFPFTCITYSLPRRLADSHNAASFSTLNTICVMPYRSRRSTKVIPPILRAFCTQPARVTTSPTFSKRSSPHVLLLYIVVSILFLYNFQFITRIFSHIAATTSLTYKVNTFAPHRSKQSPTFSIQCANFVIAER